MGSGLFLALCFLPVLALGIEPSSYYSQEVVDKLEDMLAGITEGSGLFLSDVKNAYLESSDWPEEFTNQIDAIPRFKVIKDLIRFDKSGNKLIGLESYEREGDTSQIPSLERAYEEARLSQDDYYSSTVAVEKVVNALDNFAHNGSSSSGLTIRDLQRAYIEFQHWPEVDVRRNQHDHRVTILIAILQFDPTLKHLISLPEIKGLSEIERLEREYLRLRL